jgi:predicted house-cleaning noncanonical NTP pyrophosphatase (MazG superfamily)
MTVYRKLVRDRIPEMIEQTGRKCTYRLLDTAEYVRELQLKLQEEVKEYLEEQNVEELADVLEVLISLAHVHGADEEQLMRVRTEKLEKRGGFKRGIFLEQVEG